MFERVQDQFHQFLAAAAAGSSTAPIRAAPPTHHHPNPLPLPLPPPLSFSLLHGCTSPPPQVYDSYPPHSQPPIHHHPHQILQQQLHHQWPPAAAHSNKHLGGVKQEGEGESTGTGFPSTSLVLERETSMAPSDFIDSAWSHEEVLALLRIRSAVENWFPEFTWEHVSRKLSEMGFKRSPQKCKEKFEEESRSYFQPTTTTTATVTASVANEVSCPTKINSYRLFSELEELYHHGHDPPSPPHHHHYHHHNHNHNHMLQQPPALVPDDDDSSHENQITDAILDKQNQQREEQEQGVVQGGDDDQQEQMGSEGHEEIRQEKRLLEETDGSEATHDDDQNQHQIAIDDNMIDHDEVEGEQLQIAKSERKKRRSLHQHHQLVNSKKKFEIFKSFCEEIVNKMMSQQEELHNKILQDMIRRDEEKIAREEAWKKQEMERIHLEMEARAKDLALVGERQVKIIEFLKKFSSNSSTNNDNDNDDDDNNNDKDDEAAKSAHQNPSSSATHSSSNEESISQTSTPAPNTNKIQPNFQKPRPNKRPRGDSCTQDNDTGKRWPREEVLSLINIRCNVDLNTKIGPDDCGQNRSNSDNNSSSNKNTPLWERISQKMIELGYNRSAKRCKEKWENINKYFRKTKDMNKNRSIDSRTCPYFHQLNHLYNQGRVGAGGGFASGNGGDHGGGADGAGGGAAMTVDVSDQGEVVVVLK